MPMHPNFTKASATRICHIYILPFGGTAWSGTKLLMTFVTLKIVKK